VLTKIVQYNMRDIILLSSAYLFFAFVHSFFSANVIKNCIKRYWPDYFAFYRLTFNILQTILLVILLVIVPKPVQIIWDFNGWKMVLFLSVQAVSLVGLIYAFKEFSSAEFLGLNSAIRYFRGQRTFESDEKYQLNTSGLYGISRHPLYLFSSAILLFMPRMNMFLLVSAIWAIFYFVIGSVFEERRMIRHFGREYRNYQMEVSRIFPFKWIAKNFSLRTKPKNTSPL